MPVLVGRINSLADYPVVNPNITADLNAYALDLWPPYGTDFPKIGGSTLVQNQPVNSNPRSISGRIGNSFYGDYYNRIHLNPQEMDFGNILELQTRQLYVWNAYLESSALAGYSTTDPLLSITPTFSALLPLQEFLTNVVAEPGGVSNLDDYISFDWATRPDSLLHVFGTRVSILPYQPRTQWQEVYEWLTNVIKSQNGTEQRIKLRANPRLTIEALYPIPPEDRQRAQNLVQGWNGYGWFVGLWPEATPASAITAGSFTLVADNTDSVLQYCSDVLIWQSHTLYEVVNIQSIVGTTLTTTDPVVNNYTRPVLVPLASGNTNTGIVRNTNGYASDLKAAYRIANKPEVPEVVPIQYKGEDIYYDEQLVPNSGKITEDMLTRIDEVTNRIANSRFFSPWSQTQHSRIYTVYNRNTVETINFRKWLSRRSGKFRPFWTPTFEHDFTILNTGTVTTGLTCKANGYPLYQTKRKHIAVLKTDGTWIPVEILSYTNEIADAFTLTLDTNLNFDASLIKMVCFLGLKRLDTDRVEIFYPGNAHSYASLRIVEIES